VAVLEPGARRARGLTIVAVTFLLAVAVTAQIRAALIPGSNQVARDQQLVRSAQSLETDGANLRAEIKALNDQIKALNAQLAGRSAQAGQLAALTEAEKERAGLIAASGPGITVDLADGNDPHLPGDDKRDWQVKYLDLQDVVNLLWSAGAEAVAVNRQRLIPTSSFYVAGSDVLLNGVHLHSPYRIEAIGDVSRFNGYLEDQNNLSELKNRSELYQLKLTWAGQRDLRLPAFDGAVIVRYAVAGQ
jgi:uncharacterized protein YlxW (UPF0749 family)